ncbi:MAG: sporulation membrane protein YtaF [Clostridiales bacterium]|jgi:putative sporulation protein YtaF|nr:sporulation membrane protein YtaF [Clostridiales bacterium]
MTVAALLEALLVVAALSTDTLVAGFAYGSNKIKVPFLSAQIVNLVCGAILALSLLLGHIVRPYLPAGLTTFICFAILFCLGLGKLASSFIKSLVRKHADLHKEIKFSIYSLNFILQLCADPQKADADSSQIISPSEAFTLALALSFDGLAVGFGAAIGQANPLIIVTFSLIINFGALLFGCFIGRKIVEKISLNLSWLSGALLIILAVMKLTF